TLLVERTGGREVALALGQNGGGVEGLGAQLGSAVGFGRKLFQPGPALAEVATDFPEPHEGCRRPQPVVDAMAGRGPVEGEAEVVVFLVECREAALLPGALQLRLGRRSQGDGPLQVAVTSGGRVAPGVE